MNQTSSSAACPWLARYAKLVVAMTFLLIFIGGYTTTSGAGMAFPDWPLSHGSVNPHGWWKDVMQRLEHGHRLTAETVGLLVGVLCAWVWRSKWGVPLAAGVSVVLAVIAKLAGVEPRLIAHVGLWSSALTFAVIILAQAGRRDHRHPPTIRWLAFAAFLGVLGQAVLGGLRVTIEAGGDANTAVAFRVLHGCFAQLELCLLVALAAMFSPAWSRIGAAPLRGVARLGWITAGAVFCQLIVGATMRHLGAGLAIPTWPQASPDGGWMPKAHNVFVDLNFTHTRFGAITVTVLIILFALRAIRNAPDAAQIVRPAALLGLLISVQFTLGLFVIWHLRPPMLTTFHVVNGAAVLATTVLLAVRAGHAAAQSEKRGEVMAATPQLTEVHA